MKAHPMVGDTVLAVLLSLFDLFLLVLRAENPNDPGPPAPWYVSVPVIIAVVTPIVFRRKYPVAAAYLTLVIGLGHTALELGLAAAMTTCVALYTLVAYVGRRAAALYAVVNVAFSAVQMIVEREPNWIILAITSGLLLALCWVLGEFVGARRAYQLEVEQRLSLLEIERDQQARIAVAEERARIARELHDVVAHAVSVIVVQADGAAYAVRGQPDLAERAVATISATGRQALTELRRLLGVLRSEDGERDDERTPQPGAASLTELAERVRSVGLPVRLELTGDLDDLPAGVGLGVYRIVQEALTNTLKHAGQDSSATVCVTRSGDQVDLEITDDGRVSATALVGVSGGNGLIGMRERALVFGGTLEAGPRPDGGWRVRASLPFGAN
jgi:signal transduction histidine kinase